MSQINFNVLLPKLFQLVTTVFFITVILTYFGVLLMLALAVLWYATRIVSLIGLPAPLAVAIGVAALAYVGNQVYRRPELYQLLWTIGLELIEIGQTQRRRFDPLIESARSANPS